MNVRRSTTKSEDDWKSGHTTPSRRLRLPRRPSVLPDKHQPTIAMLQRNALRPKLAELRHTRVSEPRRRRNREVSRSIRSASSKELGTGNEVRRTRAPRTRYEYRRRIAISRKRTSHEAPDAASRDVDVRRLREALSAMRNANHRASYLGAYYRVRRRPRAHHNSDKRMAVGETGPSGRRPTRRYHRESDVDPHLAQVRGRWRLR
jgi:hypothetical protein